jgi:DNA-binding transcriptional LysR family regulator
MKVSTDERRMRRVAQVWNWLPGFRAVAETGHLPSAAAMLGSSAPGLSRTIGLLEAALGAPLFERVGRRLRLNDDGARLLTAVRNAMRQVDDALDALSGQELNGTLRVAAWGSHMLPLVLPALSALRARHPGLTVHVSSPDPARVAGQLLDGALDVALVASPIANLELVCTRVGEIGSSVYAGKGHPLHRRRAPSTAEVARHGFVAPLPGIDEGWPAELPRIVSLRVSSIHEAAAVCAAGELLAVLPDPLAATFGTRLSRLGRPRVAPEPVVAVSRVPSTPHRRLDLFLEALRGR